MSTDATERVAIMRVPLGGFVLFAACFGFCAGLVLGTIALAVSPTGFLDFELTEGKGGYSLSGIRAGITFFCALPVYFSVVFTVISVPAYLPFRLVSKVLRRYKMPSDCVVYVGSKDDQEGVGSPKSAVPDVACEGGNVESSGEIVKGPTQT